MKADVDERKRVDELIFRGIESIGTINYNRDPTGKLTDVIIELKGHALGRVSATGS